MNEKRLIISSRTFMALLVFLFVCRLCSMWGIPLNDTTEARYGEIARIMQETGNWITPMHRYGEPFMAKPPLSIWLSAFSMKYLGVCALTARLPALLASIGVLLLVYRLLMRQCGQQAARLGVLVLASSIFFFIDAGTVMTDPTLLFCITLTWVSFWQALVFREKYYGYLFFVGLGLGFLAKGPVGVVLPALSIFVWLFWKNQWRACWQRLPWFSGLLLMFLIALPWYILAEYKTPGFLRYFLIGENIQRFLQPGWSGDQYGYVHHVFYGTIWLYALVGTFPWCVQALGRVIQSPYVARELLNDKQYFCQYLLAMAIVPLIFFTFAHNIIYPYVFPTLPAFAMLFVTIHERSSFLFKSKGMLVITTGFAGVALLVVTLLFFIRPEIIERSQYRVVQVFHHEKLSSHARLMYWGKRVDYSAQFYSGGHAVAIEEIHALEHALKTHHDMLVVDETDCPPQLAATLKLLKKVKNVTVLKKRYTVYQWPCST